MKTNKIIYTVCSILLFAACQQETIETYGLEESKVYFQSQTFTGANGAAGYSTSTNFSFVDRDPEVWTSVVFRATVQLMGNVKDYDRTVKVVVDAEKTTMVEGEGYVIDLDTLKIKAGANTGTIGVRFLRPMRLREQIDTLTLKLLPNEHFNILEEYKASNVWSNTTAGKIDGTRWTFAISEIYTRPDRWSGVNADAYFGRWTASKYAYINAFFGWTSTDWTFQTVIVSSRMAAYAKELQKELQRRANEGNPVYDEGGSYMQLADAYAVDYSNVNN